MLSLANFLTEAQMNKKKNQNKPKAKELDTLYCENADVFGDYLNEHREDLANPSTKIDFQFKEGTWTNLRYADGRELNLAIEAIGVTFKSPVLNNFNFKSLMLAESMMDNPIIQNALFKNGVLDKVHVNRGLFTGTVFKDTDFIDVSFVNNTDIRGATFENCSFTRCNFDDSTLANGVDFSGSTFVRCDLDGLDARDSDLRGTRFVSCKMGSADFRNAKVDQTTDLGGGEEMANVEGTTLRRCMRRGANGFESGTF